MGKTAAFAFIALITLGCNGAGDDDVTPASGEGADEASAPDSGRSGSNPWRDVESQTARSASSDSDFLASLGGVLFRTPIPTSNGRACSTCHIPEKNFTISPAEVEARFQKNPKDPLFRSIDADDFANDFTTLRTKALFRVTIPLPDNISLVGSSAREVKLFRAVPSVFNVKLTAPYTHDGRAAALDEQAKGAALDHSRPTFVPPDAAFDLVALFQQKQFSSAAVKSASDLLDAGQTPPPPGQDYDGPLNALEQQGFAAFQEHCIVCHGGNARNQIDQAAIPLSFFTAFVSELNRANLPVLDFDVTNPDGTVTRVSSPDPGRMLISGQASDANFFDSTPLRGISKTAPYFHDNSARNFDELFAHYNILFTAFGFPTIRPDQVAPLTAYLNRL